MVQRVLEPVVKKIVKKVLTKLIKKFFFEKDEMKVAVAVEVLLEL